MPLFFNNIRNGNNSNALILGFWYNDPVLGHPVNYHVVVSISEAIYNNIINYLLNTINIEFSTNISTYYKSTAV